jgi:glycosyltransferase involved in cell wall biosynthesis
MKKIVIDARGYKTTTGRYVRKLIEYLEQLEANQKERSYVVLLHKNEFEQYQPANAQFSKQIADYAHYGLAEQVGFLRFLQTLKADLVHFSMPQQPILYRGKSVTTIHDLTLLRFFPGNKNRLVFKIKQAVGSFVFKQIANTNQHLLANSQFTKDDYVEFSGIDPKKVTVTLLGADVETKKPVPHTPLVDKSYILYVGQQSEHKNLWRLVEAHQALLPHHPDLQLVIAGKLTPAGEQLKDKAKQAKYKNICYAGFVEDAELAWLYQNSAAYVFPSLSEGFGLPGLEAMAYKAPVVSSNATCLPEVYDDAAHYFDPTDIQDMAEKISEVLTNKKLRSTLIKNGTRQLKKFSWKRTAEKTLEVYISSLQNK